MKAFVYRAYGPPEVLRLEEVPAPVPRDDELLVRIRATTVSAGDWRMRRADPWLARLFNGLLRPKRVTILGFELSGEVEAAGRAVGRFKAGDEVFGSSGLRFGAYAEQICLPADGAVAHKPAGVSHEEAAAVPVGGMTALGMLRRGEIAAGQRVLIYGASGSVGTYAVQLARHLGAEVTGVCSGANLELVRSLGAARVVDYTREDVTAGGARYELIFDAVGRRMSGVPPSAFKRALAPGGRFVSAEMSHEERAEELVFLAGLLEAGELRAVIDRRYRFEQLPEAHAYVEQQRKRGNVVITISEEAQRS